MIQSLHELLEEKKCLEERNGRRSYEQRRTSKVNEESPKGKRYVRQRKKEERRVENPAFYAEVIILIMVVMYIRR